MTFPFSTTPRVRQCRPRGRSVVFCACVAVLTAFAVAGVSIDPATAAESDGAGNASAKAKRQVPIGERRLPAPPKRPAREPATESPNANKDSNGKNAKKKDRLQWLTEHPVIREMWRQCNAERARYGLPALKLSPSLCQDAQRHAEWMAETGWYQHSALPWAEIIHHGPQTVTDCINGWIYSPAHHGIMLGGFRECGFGYMQRDGYTYWVGVFR